MAAEALSPNPRPRQPMSSRIIQSPTSPFVLGSNDDQLERAQARAARAAAIRRKPVTVRAPPPDSDPCLGKDQILELFRNCIKLASENKINQKNTWELNLIDHLCDIIKVEEENDTETNFQKASCTLEAGVKIYSLRVDSVHSEAYKVLGGMNRAGQDNDEGGTVEDANVQGGQDEGPSKKETEKKYSPFSTLEPSFEALNMKKFDVAFAVDPLYHQTSAQFDEGGAKGLLLNNLGVYGGCRVLFDSLEVPGKEVPRANHDKSEVADLSFAREYLEQMVLNMEGKHEISPTLRQIVDQFDEDNTRRQDTFSCERESTDQVDNANKEFDNSFDAFDNSETCGFDHDDQSSVIDEDFNGADPSFTSYPEGSEQFSSQNHDIDDRSENIDGFLFLSLGFSSKHNAWAGPDHWKYRKVKGPEDGPSKENEVSSTTKKARNRKEADSFIDFMKALDEDMTDIFAPPKNPKTLLLPANRTTCITKLPEDCHYQPEELVKLFLLPNVMCFGRRRRKLLDEPRQQFDEDETFPSWGDDGCEVGDAYDDDHNDIADFDTLVSQPRQVNKIEVKYDKTSKQVDVQALKETLWNQIQLPQKSTQDVEETLSFKHILASFPADCKAAATISEISPHLCFICLLHLANEHGLSIHGSTDLDDLSIKLPSHGSSEVI